MNRRRLIIACAVTLCASALAGTLNDLPGWAFEGSDRASFTVARDLEVKHAGRAAAMLRANREPQSFGALIQAITAEKYVGRRVRFSAWSRTAGVTGFAGLVMRVEGPSADTTLAFDNMQDRPVRGTTEWTLRTVVLDVAPSARRIHFGVMLSGQGTVWLDDGKLEIVDSSVPTTGPQKVAGPRNFDFEE